MIQETTCRGHKHQAEVRRGAGEQGDTSVCLGSATGGVRYFIYKGRKKYLHCCCSDLTVYRTFFPID